MTFGLGGKRKIKWDEVEKYLREYVKKYYEIEAYSDKIYIGKIFRMNLPIQEILKNYPARMQRQKQMPHRRLGN